MIFSKKLRKTAASVLALVMVFAMSTGAFADSYAGVDGATATDGYYTVTVNYTISDISALPTDAQISIIALEGFAENAEESTVEVRHENNTATNVLWIDQQAVSAEGHFTFQVDKAKVADNGFHVKSGVTGGETMMDYVTVASQAPEVPKSDDAKLGTLKVGGQDVTLDHTNGTAAITVAAGATSAKIEATANDSKAKSVVIAGADNDGNVTLATGDNEVKITVTAENGDTKDYTLTITVPASQGGGDDDDDDTTGTTIPDANITIGGTQIGDGQGQTSASTPITSTKPFDIENGHVVRVKHKELEVGETPTVPNKIVANGGDTTGIQTFYTEYPTGTDGKTVIKLVTIITDSSLTAGDLTLVDGTPERLKFGDANDDNNISVDDAIIAVQIVANQITAGTIKSKLATDANGDGKISVDDAIEMVQMVANSNKIPIAATK